jgi:hypothetical protein
MAMADTDGGAEGPRQRRRRLGVAALAVAVLAGIGIAIATRAGDDTVAVPSPLFDQVEQLAPTELPDGWERCGGGASERPDAHDGWWAQTFGPADDGECTPLITVTQVPPDDRVRMPKDATNGGIGEEPGRTGAKLWSDRVAGSRGLYTTASGGLQRLVIEGCCTEEAVGDQFDLVANAARDATRERPPARCTAPHSDLDQESFLTNYFARQARALDEDDCPVRGDIVSWRTEPAGHHCWPNVTFLAIGNPVGTAFTDAGRTLTYVRDANHELGDGASDQELDLDAALPGTAVDTTFHQDGGHLWVDPSDDGRVYVEYEDHVEAWPLDQELRGCA